VLNTAVNSERFEGLQILRACAALMVVVYHTLYEMSLSSLYPSERVLVSQLMPWMAGVDLFFVISGFVMVYASRHLFEETGAWHVFLRRRIARIVPLYWLVTLVFLGMLLIKKNTAEITFSQIVSSFAFFPFPHANGNIQPVYTLGWTLNYEMFFYALFACVVGLRWQRAVLTLLIAMALWVALGFAISLPQPFEFWSRPILLEFGAGMFLGAIWLRGVHLSPMSVITLMVTGILSLILASPTGTQTGWNNVLFLGLPCALLVASAVLGEQERCFVAIHRVRFLRKVMIAQGDASYALYLVHPFLVKAFFAVFMEMNVGSILPFGVTFALVLLLCGCVSVVIYHTLEMPLTRFARALLKV
jgi:exopolysaccharide production protein ExoZ